MQAVNITELRSHLPMYLHRAEKGNEILVTSHGKVIARIVPPTDIKADAQKKLRALRKQCQIGDVTSPIDEDWDAEK